MQTRRYSTKSAAPPTERFGCLKPCCIYIPMYSHNHSMFHPRKSIAPLRLETNVLCESAYHLNAGKGGDEEQCVSARVTIMTPWDRWRLLVTVRLRGLGFWE
jgi:hypothetical protein